MDEKIVELVTQLIAQGGDEAVKIIIALKALSIVHVLAVGLCVGFVVRMVLRAIIGDVLLGDAHPDDVETQRKAKRMLGQAAGYNVDG